MVSYLSNQRNCILGKKDMGYLCKVKQKKKNISTIIFEYSKGHYKRKKEISLNPLITQNIKKQSFYFKLNHAYFLKKNKIRLLYSINKSALPKDRSFYGGYVDINLKTGKITKGIKVKFSPEVLENGYLCGSICYTNKYNYEPYLDKYYIIADAKTGKTIQKFSINYGLEKSNFITSAEKNGFEKYKGLPQGEDTYTFQYSHDWKEGKLLFTNVSGIYYASAKSNEIIHILNFSDMPYYGGNENKRYLHAIALKNKFEFYVLYGNAVYGESIAKEYLVRYQLKK